MPTPSSQRSSPALLRVKRTVGPAVERAVGVIEPWRKPVSRTARPILVCGCSHSGTTVVARFLGQHPNVHTVAYESNIFCTSRPKRSIAGAFDEWAREARSKGRERVCEKTPNHVFHLERIFRCFPHARLVLVERDGRDVAASLARRWNGDVERAARKWVAAADAARPWKDDERVLVVRYEAFVEDTASVAARMSAHVGEAFTPVMLEPDDDWQWRAGEVDASEAPPSVQGADHMQYRAWQVQQPVFDGRGRWAGELTEADREVCRRIAGPVLDELGYAAPGTW